MTDIIVPTLELEDSDHELIATASATLRARFAVGRHHVAAALRLDDGSVVTGLHLGSRRVNLCAEQVGLGAAMSNFDAVPVACASVIKMTPDDESSPTSPCGICREVLGYFYPAMTVVICLGSGLVKARFADLLPAPWLLPGEMAATTTGVID
jgi:cytidine deaminase